MLITLSEKPAWHWYWVASFSIGTYLLYVDGTVLVDCSCRLDRVARRWCVSFTEISHPKRCNLFSVIALGRKVQHMDALLDYDKHGSQILDLGAGEGYVGEEMAARWHADVSLVDVCNMNQTQLSHTLYDGEKSTLSRQAFRSHHSLFCAAS